MPDRSRPMRAMNRFRAPRCAATRDRRGRVIALLACFLLACGGGGKSDDDDDGGDAAAPLSAEEQSARFLAQATLGANMEEIERTRDLGFESWLDEQLALPPSRHLPVFERLVSDYGDPAEDFAENSPIFRRYAWWDRLMSAPDTLRQRVALALSEIFVISDLTDLLFINPDSVASYYDMLLENAFGSYEDLLLDVTLHPAMGVYLSHLHNDKSDPAIGRYPDENYAREVMQLFSIGLFELNPDGSLVLDAGGDPIPTYSNFEITEFAKVFTGLGLRGPLASFGGYLGSRTLPMRMYEEHHEPGAKTLLGGYVIPDGQTGMEDIEEAIGHLADHPNVGPFMARRLIQRLVKSNPSPAYIERISDVWADDGNGARGNLGAVIRAILLDKEARRDPGDEDDGFLREPFLRFVTLLRTFDASSPSGEFLIEGAGVGFVVGQHPMSSPSVFNFFQPDFAPNGPVKQAGRVAPEFQVTTDASVIALANLATAFLFNDPAFPAPVVLFREGTIEEEDIPMALDLADELALSDDIDALMDRLDLLLTYGTLSEPSREAIIEVLEHEDMPAAFRPATAIHLILMSPDFAIVD